MAPTKGHRTPCSTSQEMAKKYVKLTKTISVGIPVMRKQFDEIKDVQEKLYEMEGIETNLQKVFFAEKKLENSQVLDYERKDGSSVHMELQIGFKMQVNVKVSWSGKLITLNDLNSYNTVNDVKTKFQENEGIPANQFTLIYAGQQLEDFKTLEACGINSLSTIFAVFLGEDKIGVAVRMPGGEIYDVKVKLCSSVDNLKTMFHCMMGSRMDMLELKFNGKLLENGRILADYKVANGSLLDMTYLLDGVMKIYVKTLTGKTNSLYVNSSCTINNLKKKIEYMEGLPRDQQRLIFDGRQMVDENTVGDYGIYEECSIHLVHRLCGC